MEGVTFIFSQLSPSRIWRIAHFEKSRSKSVILGHKNLKKVPRDPGGVSDGIAYTHKIPCSCGVVMRSSPQTSQPWWKGESRVVGRNSPVCWELSCRQSWKVCDLRTGLSGSPVAQNSLVINIEGLSWQTSAWPTRNKLQPAGKCCNYICGAILEIRLVVVFHR